MSIDDFKGLMDEFDPASLLPELDTIIDKLPLLVRIAVLIGPVMLLVMGLLYFFASPKEANYHFGYRCYYGMGSVEAWRFTQKIAGILFTVLGVALLAISLLLSNRFPDLEPSVMLDKAVVCILWQIGITLVLSLMINLIVALRYDRNGDLRSEKSRNNK